jgi:hypothetical protein
MKSTGIIVICLLSFFACKKDLDSRNTFPEAIIISNSGCLQAWETLNFATKNYGKNMRRFDVKAWFGTVESNIITNPNKFSFSSGGDGLKFVILNRDLEDANYIFVRLTGYGDSGIFGESNLYKFKKKVRNDCVTWEGY